MITIKADQNSTTAAPTTMPTPQGESPQPAWLPDLERFIEERIDVDALSTALERLCSTEQLDQRIQRALRAVRRQLQIHGRILEAMRTEIRSTLLELEQMKRAVASANPEVNISDNHVDREFVREVFPPTRPNLGTGVKLSPAAARPAKSVDCASRIHICRAACCRVFHVFLTKEEVPNPIYNWNVEQPYMLHRTTHGCTHLDSGQCSCAIYDQRPKTCKTYSCANDRRIWADFENMVLNPRVQQLLDRLDAMTAGSSPPDKSTASADEMIAAMSNDEDA